MAFGDSDSLDSSLGVWFEIWTAFWALLAEAPEDSEDSDEIELRRVCVSLDRGVSLGGGDDGHEPRRVGFAPMVLL